MSCEDFRQSYREMVSGSAGIEDSRRSDWSHHLHECQRCGDWYEAQQVRDRGADPAGFPCVHVANRVTYKCSEHEDPWECPDYILVYNEKFDEYGIPVRDGGSSKIDIDFCPWCGVKLPPSKRDLWFETLASLGYDDPWSQDLPKEFESGLWWRRRQQGEVKPE
jgi:hypothetical protein